MLNSPQTDAPETLTAADAGVAGNLDGTYFYAVTFVSPLGETNFGPLAGPLVLANSQAALAAIPVSSDLTVTARNLYRTAGAPLNSDYVYFLAQIADNITTTFTDNLADASLGPNIAPSVNQTSAISLGSTQAFAYGAGALGSLLLGPDALANNTGASNVAIGDRALASNTLGRFNLAIGYQALFSNSTGENNFAIGSQALYMNTTGVVNVAIGSDAMYANISGDHNTTIGVDSLTENTTGSYNAGLSYDALHSNITGSGGTALGYQTLYGNTTGNGNTALGFQAGMHGTTGSNNIYIGSNADTSDGTLSNAIAIGQNVTLSASNQIMIGNSSHTDLILPALDVSGLASLTASGAVTAASVSASGAVGAASITATGTITAGAFTTTGLVGAGSVTVFGAVGAASVTASGTVTGGAFTTSGSVSAGSITASGAVGAASLTTSGAITANGQLIGKGTATNDSAAAGYIGEYISSEIAPGSGMALTSGVATNITSISLTAGDWNVWGNVLFRPANGTTVSSLTGFLSTASTTYPGTANAGGAGRMVFPAGFVPNDDLILAAGMRRISIAATTAVYLETVQYFSGGSMTGSGFIGARRVR